MARFFSEDEVDPSLILSSSVAVIGYGNQGHAHALNLRDNGVSVIVGAYEGSTGGEAARTAGFDVRAVADAVRESDMVMLTLPDVPMRGIFESEVRSALRTGQTLLFAHGFNIHYGLFEP